jgi:phage FluMu gp28-like protein
MDIGRKKDLSVLWLDVDVANVLRTLAVIEMHKTPFYVQRQVLFAILMHRAFRRACIDESGIGLNLAESATDRFGSCVEGVPFSAANKETIATGLKQNFEDAASAIPAGSTIRNSLHSVKKYATATKHFRFDAERSDQTGHADHFWAKGLSVLAYSSPQDNREWDICTGGASVANGIMRGF